MLKVGLVLCFLAALGGAQGSNISCSQPADIAFLLHDSRNISAEDFKEMITFVKELVAQFDISLTSTRIAVIKFSHGTDVEFTFGVYNTLSEVERGLDAIQQRKWDETKLNSGIHTSRFILRANGRRDVPHILIAITSGLSDNRAETVRQANLTRGDGVEIFIIGVGSLDQVQLEEIASEPFSDHLFNVTEYSELSSLGGILSEKTCPDTGLTDIPSDQVAAQEACYQMPAEVVFVLDISSSIFMHDFQKQLAFVSSLIRIFDIGENETRVAAISFSTNATVEFHLDEFYDQKDVRDHVEMIRYTGGGTNTGDALKLVNDSVLISERGVRSNVSHVVIVVTDGRSENSTETKAQANVLKDSGVLMFAIGVGPYVDDQELEAIASEPSENFIFTIADYDTLTSIKNTLALRVCDVGIPGNQTEIDAE
ncbi:collagen alpha-1(XIV) chain [Aplysia californica]|uniref:Collagen alpha-1(XIV) chain n=1 Tax=Aplysia californica TaxID=6500 RepID=A0ABM0JNQ8_APLCA|nr:collagen alpha-1(XIV) chain [Aplysia californica]